MIKKITTGFVIQNFTENEKGKNIGYYQVYHSFNMEQK